MQLFERTLTGGFSYVNTRLSFDSEILLLNLTQSYKMNQKQPSRGAKQLY